MKTVVITGISSGIGKALAQYYLERGARVIGTSTSGTLDFQHENLRVIKLDLENQNSIDGCVAEIEKSGHKIDILHNNAGVLLDQEETHIVMDKFRKTLEINLIGTIDFTEKMLPLLDNHSHIVNTTSSAGSITDTDFETPSHYPFHYPAYKISKAGMNMYTRILAMNLIHENRAIRVSAVHPGWVKTSLGGMGADFTPEEAAKDLYELAHREVETGQFWFKGQKFPW